MPEGSGRNTAGEQSLILGLTGSLGSGKSFVSSLFTLCHAKVICADQLAREAVKQGTAAFEEIRRTFGESVVAPDGSLDRQHLARIVFRDPPKRKKLESIVHPHVRERELELIGQYRGFPLVVLDVPLLYESGMDAHCHKVAVVTIGDEQRIERLKRDRSMTREEIEERLAAQMPQEEKAGRADFLIDNSGTRQQTAMQLNQILGQIFPHGLPKPLLLLHDNIHTDPH
ncbi:MAG: dephospho-CoA kinase [Candidatus Sumerlaeia bacterium]|nr:dephospho-CoA kinase [Candidatus Sumerlaeia bacterium]